MNKRNPKVDGYMRKNKEWAIELEELRKIILDSELTEEVKWRVPVYTLNDKNVVFLGAFKQSAVISFVKGVLLKDKKKILIQQTEESQSVRVIYFKSAKEITAIKSVLKDYIHEAIENEKAGVKVPMKKITDRKIPDELQKKFGDMPELKKAFQSLTPGRQRMYLIYIAGAKQEKTREARVEKYVKQILAGKGMDD